MSGRSGRDNACHAVAPRGAAQCSALWRGKACSGVAWRGMAWRCRAGQGRAGRGRAGQGTAQHSTASQGMDRLGTARYGRARHGAARQSTARHRTAQGTRFIWCMAWRLSYAVAAHVNTQSPMVVYAVNDNLLCVTPPASGDLICTRVAPRLVEVELCCEHS